MQMPLFNFLKRSGPTFPEKLLQLDYLIFSSHKSGTQTLVHSLNSSGLKSRHCHLLENIEIEKGQFKSFVRAYNKLNSKKLNIISVFRNPLERHISSFFQWYGTRPLQRKELQHESETMIFIKSVPELQRQFIDELQNDELHGKEESIEVLCGELNINPRKLPFDPDKKMGVYESKKIRIYLLRFDLLFNDFEETISQITGRTINQVNQNMGIEKWYADKYLEFKKTLHVPDDIMRHVFEKRRKLINVFYPGEFDKLVLNAIEKYAVSAK
jgi:hypothetical protein